MSPRTKRNVAIVPPGEAVIPAATNIGFAACGAAKEVRDVMVGDPAQIYHRLHA